MDDLIKQIKSNLDHPGELERLYQDNQLEFVEAFDQVYVEESESVVLKVWHERLHFQSMTENKGKNSLKDILFIIVLSLIAGTIAKVLFDSVENREINPANMAFALLPILSFYFISKNPPRKQILLGVVCLFLVSLVYINVLPAKTSDSIILANLHLPFFLWSLLGVSFLGDKLFVLPKRMEYLRYNGELLIYTVIILVGGVALTALTIGLFSVIQIDIREFYIRTVVVYGIAASPVVATYLTMVRSNAAKNLAPNLAKIFSPLVLITLVVYLLTVIVLGKNPYTDRNFLIIFNAMLLLVLAITTFTISERGTAEVKSLNDYIIVALVVVALTIDTIALSAILFRLSSYGITPNRTAVLGVNLVVFINLIRITKNYLGFLFGQGKIRTVEESITRYLPIYSIWTIIVTFVFPLIFWFK